MIRKNAQLLNALNSLIEEERVRGELGDLTPEGLGFYEELHSRLMADEISSYRLNTLTRRTIDSWTKRQLGRYSRETVNKTRKHLKRALLRAGCNVAELFATRFRVRYEPRQRWLSLGEATELVSTLADHRASLVSFILATAASYRPATMAMPGDINWPRQTIRVRGTKGLARRRVLPIVSITRPFARTAYDWLRHHDSFAEWHRGSRQRDLAVACRRAGIERCTFHDLRRSVGHWVYHATGDIGLTSLMMGHSNTNTTLQIYGRLQGQHLGEALRKRGL